MAFTSHLMVFLSISRLLVSVELMETSFCVENKIFRFSDFESKILCFSLSLSFSPKREKERDCWENTKSKCLEDVKKIVFVFWYKLIVTDEHLNCCGNHNGFIFRSFVMYYMHAVRVYILYNGIVVRMCVHCSHWYYQLTKTSKFKWTNEPTSQPTIDQSK